MKKILIIFPGNPGIPGIYSNLVTSLDREYDNHHTLTHIGQSSDNTHKYKEITLEDNFKSHLDQFHAILKEYDLNDQIDIIGHSLGCSSILSNLEDLERASKITFICPFIHAQDHHIDFLKKVQRPIFKAITRPFLNFSSRSRILSELTIRSYIGRTSMHSTVMRSAMTPYLLSNFFTLVYSYPEHFTKLSYMDKLFAQDSSRFRFIYAQEDFWCPKEIREKLQKFKDGAILDIPHDFCLAQHSTRLVVEEIKKASS